MKNSCFFFYFFKNLILFPNFAKIIIKNSGVFFALFGNVKRCSSSVRRSFSRSLSLAKRCRSLINRCKTAGLLEATIFSLRVAPSESEVCKIFRISAGSKVRRKSRKSRVFVLLRRRARTKRYGNYGEKFQYNTKIR